MPISTDVQNVRLGRVSLKGENRTYLWKLPVLMIFFFDNARKTLETTSKVGFS
jgi:hypothetical protein